MDVMIDAYNRTGDSKYSDLFDKWYVGIKAKNGGSYWRRSGRNAGGIDAGRQRVQSGSF